MHHGVWELVFLMVILKIPILYLCGVIYYAIKAEPRPAKAPASPRGSGRMRARALDGTLFARGASSRARMAAPSAVSAAASHGARAGR